MKKSNPISILHVIFLSMTVIGMKNHVTILPPLLQVGGRDGWASVVLATLVMLPWGILLLYIHKKSNQEPIRYWLKEKIGKVNSFIFLYTTIAYSSVSRFCHDEGNITIRDEHIFTRNPFYVLVNYIYNSLCTACNN